jgi:peptide deformylase
MAVRPFIPYPDKRLSVVCDRVEAITDVERGIWQDMFDSMYDMPGVGLAACQIGITRALAVVDAGDGHDQPVRMANPVILHTSAVMREHQEGSPNLPGVWANLERPRAVTVEYMDENGNQDERDFVGVWATSVQHQVDHLNGRMFFDHLSATKRKMLITKSQKLVKKGLI